jgi:phospholipid/cholesterol/gamma-HCH transport system substrate-binding protein
VQIEFSNSKDYVKTGDTLLAGYVSNGLQAVQSQAQALIASMDSAIGSINSIFNSETKQNLQKSVKHIESTLSTLDNSTAKVDIMLSENVGRLQKIFQNIESITTNLNQNQDKINEVINNLASVSDSVRQMDIAATIRQAKDVLVETSEVMNKINSGQGSLGMLVNDDKLYRNLEASSKSLDSLIVDMKSNPNRYVHFSVFGKKNKPAGQ